MEATKLNLIITSSQNNLIKEAIKLKQKKYRTQEKLFLVEGYHLVEEAKNTGSLKWIFYLDDNPYTHITAYQVSESILKKLSDLPSPQGIVGVCSFPNKSLISERILLLDNVQDPGNIGTLIRSAVAFGYKTIVAENSVDFFNEKVIRSSQGAIFKLALINTNLENFIKKNKDYLFLATDLNADINLDELELNTRKIAVILGNEGQGVRKEILELVKVRFKIKIEEMESLNVSVAGSIIMYEINKRSER